MWNYLMTEYINLPTVQLGVLNIHTYTCVCRSAHQTGIHGSYECVSMHSWLLHSWQYTFFYIYCIKTNFIEWKYKPTDLDFKWNTRHLVEIKIRNPTKGLGNVYTVHPRKAQNIPDAQDVCMHARVHTHTNAYMCTRTRTHTWAMVGL